MRIKQSQQ